MMHPWPGFQNPVECRSQHSRSVNQHLLLSHPSLAPYRPICYPTAALFPNHQFCRPKSSLGASHSCSKSASSLSRAAKRSSTIFRILFKFDILLSISWISALHIFFRIPIISNLRFSTLRSFFREPIVGGRAPELTPASFNNLCPYELRLRCDILRSLSFSGREA